MNLISSPTCHFRFSIFVIENDIVITGRNEVVAKVIFLHLSVIHSVHGGEGVCLSACWDTTPPRPGRHPLGPGRHPPGSGRHPQTRQTPPDQVDPPGPGRHPPGKHTPAYGLPAAGTHPTGMHSCWQCSQYLELNPTCEDCRSDSFSQHISVILLGRGRLFWENRIRHRVRWATDTTCLQFSNFHGGCFPCSVCFI